MGAWEDGWIVDIQVTLVTEEKLWCYQWRKYTHLQTKQFKYWEQYREGTMSTTQFTGLRSDWQWQWAGRLETYSHGLYDMCTVSDVFWCTFLCTVIHRNFFQIKSLMYQKVVLFFSPSEPYKLPPYIAKEKNKVVSYQRQFVPSLEGANYSKNKESHFVPKSICI